MSEEKNVRIMKLTAENILNLKFIEIIPKKDTVIIAGKNSAGKTDILNAIWWALGGTKKIPSEPIRKGEDKGYTEVDLGDYIATRKFKRKGETSYLEVRNKKGVPLPSPQALLDRLLGDLTFNPVELMTAKNRDEILLDIAGLKDKLEKLDKERQEKYQERTFVNREVKKLEPLIKKDLKQCEEIDISKLVNLSKEIRITEETISRIENTIENLQEEIRTKQNRIRDDSKTLISLREKLHKYGTTSEKVQQEILSAQETNQQAQEFKENSKTLERYNDIKKDSDDLTKRIETIDKEKEKLIKNAKFPVKEMGYRDKKVTYKDIPLDQLSKSEEILLGVQIQMELHPKLRVILIPDASLLDRDNMKKIQELAKKKDYQIWIERVEEDVGIIIKDGTVKEDKQ